jgi:hypothetical protein
MQRFFEECAKEPTSCARNYSPEVLRRTITQEILMVLDEEDIASAELDNKVAKTDRRLRSYLVESDFVWDSTLQPAYPRDDFWWMYMTPRE